MAISFDSLPNAIPNSFPVIPTGVYKATVEKAEMKNPKDDSKPPYLSLTWKVMDANGKTLGRVFDILAESESPYVLYKIRSFVQAIEVDLGKSFELKDLCKVSTGRTCMLAINTKTNERTGEDQNQVNIFHEPPYAKVIPSAEDFMVCTEEEAVPFEEAAKGSY